MAIDSYANLQTAVLNWMGRPADPILLPRAPDWITLYESRANRELRLRAMEVRIDAAISGEYIALPPDFLQMRNFQINGTDKTEPLEMVAPEFIDRLGVVTADTPKRFAIVADEIQLSPRPNASMTAEMVYWAKIAALSGEEGSTTNHLLTNHPELYLFGTLVEGSADIGDDEAFAKWEARYQVAVQKVQQADDAAKWSGATMVRRIPGIIYADNHSRVRD